jgi:hypothetical protein
MLATDYIFCDNIKFTFKQNIYDDLYSASFTLYGYVLYTELRNKYLEPDVVYNQIIDKLIKGKVKLDITGLYLEKFKAELNKRKMTLL